MKLLIRLVLVGISLFIVLIAGTILLRLPEESAPLDEVTAVNQPVVDGRVTVEVLMLVVFQGWPERLPLSFDQPVLMWSPLEMQALLTRWNP